MHRHPDRIHLIPWRGGHVAFRPGTGWARAVREDLPAWIEPPPSATPAWRRRPSPRFRCLTVLLEGPCGLACTYCYGRFVPDDAPPLDPAALAAAADRVAEDCWRTGAPMVLGLHGTCEPLADLARAVGVVELVAGRARKRGLTLQVHASSSGVLGPDARAWAARVLSSISLSWDGPAEVHDRLRLLRAGGGSHAALLDTLDALRGSGVALRLRSTVTRSSLAPLAAAMPAMADAWGGPMVFQPEPLYLPEPGQGDAPDAPDSMEFARTLLEAGRRLPPSARLELAASRPGAPHQRHCFPWQHNLVVRGDGSVHPCFLASTWQRPPLGGMDEDGAWRLDEGSLEGLLDRTSSEPTPCARCFAWRHCARGCPQRCPLVEPETVPEEGYCRMVRSTIMLHLLERMGLADGAGLVDELLQLPLPPDPSVGGGP